MEDRPVRKPNRLREYDYSRNGAYFITFCVEGRHQMLCEIVEDAVSYECGDSTAGVHDKKVGEPTCWRKYLAAFLLRSCNSQ